VPKATKKPAPAPVPAPAPKVAAPKAPKKAPAAAQSLQTSTVDLSRLIQEKVRELIRLAKEQGYLTFEDLDEHLPVEINNPDHIDSIISQLRAVEIDIIQSSDVDRVKEVHKNEEEEEKDEKDEKEDKDEKKKKEKTKIK
jgi:RNA polymerase primary sigma factor